MQLDIKDATDKADMIINGYAFTKDYDYIRVLNLNHTNRVAVILSLLYFKLYYWSHACTCQWQKTNRIRFGKIFCYEKWWHNDRKQGQLNDREIRKIREFIKDNYKDMYLKWREIADTGFYGEN